MALPLLPGNSFNPNLGKVKYHKSHHFDINNDVSMMVGEEKPGIGGDILPGQKTRPRNSAIPRGQGTDVPAWVAFDKQVLCFDAYFQEAVHEQRVEQIRVRKCKIYFYLEDDSIQVIEPRIKNAGIPQGTIIRRHRIPLPPPNDNEFYTVDDFNIGNEITLYSRTFKLTGCDEFTQNFLCKLGVRVNRDDAIPSDPYIQHRKALDESMQPLRPYEKHDTLKQFLDHDRNVLRFYCYWDDTDQMFGDPREMVLHYFLADDTIEIREMIPANSGRDATPMFLHRAKLPKIVDPLKQPGEVTDRTVLNVFGPTGHGGRYILDSLKTGAVNQQFYTDNDLTIGAVINVWGRKFTICDCDDYTKEYYNSKYGITDFTPITYKRGQTQANGKEMPPYNGFGSEEDSLCSCMGLLPKPPKRDFIKFMEKDRKGLDSNVLRFLARMDTTKPIDMDRKFIISYFLSDDTILVFEQQVRNSGIMGGKFMERGRVKKPNQPRYSTQLSEYFQAQDLYIGARVDFNNHVFILIDADEYAYNYMDRHADEFPQANMQMIMSKLRAALQGKTDQLTGETMDIQHFRQVLRDACAGSLTEQEIITVARYYQDRKNDGANNGQLVAIAQEHLRKAGFSDFAKVQQMLDSADTTRSGLLCEDDIFKACNSAILPLPSDLLRALVASLPSVQCNAINYNDFLRMINWRDCPVSRLAPMQPPEDNYQGNQHNNQLTSVNVQNLKNDL